MKIYVFDFYKDKLSTAQPALSDGREIEVSLKEPCSVLRPVFRLSLAQGTNFNYIRAALAGESPRYYYVADITYDKCDIIVTCIEDFRASGRDIILLSEQYVERCSDPLITGTEKLSDAYYMPGNNMTVSVKDSGAVFSTAGFYVMGLAASGVTNAITRGGINYVIMTKAEMEGFSALLQQHPISLLSIIKPIDYIYSCVYIPFDLPAGVQTITDTIQMNDYTGISLEHIKADSAASLVASNGMITKNITCVIPSHPEQIGDFVDYAPFKRTRLVAGPFGEVDLPLEFFGSSVGVSIRCDITDGSAVGIVTNPNNDIVMKLRSKVGIPTALAQLSSNMAGLIGSGLSAVGAAGSLLTGNPIGGVVGLASSATSAISALVPRPQTVGMNGSYAELYDSKFHTVTEMYDVIASNNTDVGHLVMKNVTLSTIASGSYVKCRDARMIFGGYAEEHDEIIRALDEGIYLI